LREDEGLLREQRERRGGKPKEYQLPLKVKGRQRHKGLSQRKISITLPFGMRELSLALLMGRGESHVPGGTNGWAKKKRSGGCERKKFIQKERRIDQQTVLFGKGFQGTYDSCLSVES